MFRINPPLQDSLIDFFDFLGPKRKELIETGWPSLFQKYLINELPIAPLKTAFHASLGRPTKELYTVSGVLILQQLFDLTDQETVHQLAFNIEWHYALNLLDEEDESKYTCERTLRTYRELLTKLELDGLLFQSLTDKLLDVLKIHTGKQRLDSTHIRSDMRRLSRLGLFRRTIQKFLKVMTHDHPKILRKQVSEDLISKYMEKEKSGYFAQVKPSEAKTTLQQVAEDLLVLVETFRHHPKIRKMPVFASLERVLEEQCEVTGEGEELKVILRDPKDVSSASLQNPSDTDAGYSGHKGEGFQVQLMETFYDDEDQEAKQPDLITYLKVESAACSDSDAPLPAIEETKERGCAPKELLADTAYGSDENVQEAAKEGTDLIAPTMGKPKSKEEMLILDDFWVDEETGKVTACPSGEVPCEIREGKHEVLKIHFDPAVCEVCDHCEYCCVGLASDNKLEYTPKKLRLAQRRVAEESEEFREKYRWRSGIEATNAKLKRKLKIGRLRVRGLAKVRYAVTLKVLGWNILQAVRA